MIRPSERQKEIFYLGFVFLSIGKYYLIIIGL